LSLLNLNSLSWGGGGCLWFRQLSQSYALDHKFPLTQSQPYPRPRRWTGKVNYPDPVKLDGQDIPWVESVVHLGHTLHQLTSMERDCQVARARLIDKAVTLREDLSFANPDQILKAINQLLNNFSSLVI
jgi:hypothetical protein